MNKSTKISKNKINLIYAKNYSELSKLAFQEFLNIKNLKQTKLIFLPTGKTPIGFYKNAREYYKVHKKELRKFFFINLDDYLQIPQSNSMSFKFYLNQKFSKPLNLSFRQYYWMNNKSSIQEERETLNKYLKRYKRIEMCILGLGENGHIAFNEPNCNPQEILYDAKLTKNTIDKIDNKDFTISKGRTVGLGLILSAKKILLLVSGSNKKRALKQLMKKKIDPKWPVTYLCHHPNLTVIVN